MAKTSVCYFTRCKKIKKVHPIPKLIIAMYHPMYYTNLTEAKVRIQKTAVPLNNLTRFNSQQDAKKILAKYPTADSWYGLSGLKQNMVVLINKETAEVIKIVDLRPWN